MLKEKEKTVDWFIEIAEKEPLKAYRLLLLLKDLSKLSDKNLGRVVAFAKGLSRSENKGVAAL